MAYYGKLSVVLLSEIASAREDSYRCRIADYLLRHLGEVLSADRIARDCYVSRSAVSRFCREIGLEDFNELRDIMSDSDRNFVLIRPDLSGKERADTYSKSAAEAINRVPESLDFKALERMIQDIQKAKRVACFGLLKAETAAINLQCDLTMLGKKAVTKVSYKDQMDFLSQSEESDIVLIFSYRGVFFEYDLPTDIHRGKAKVWIITGNPEAYRRLKKLPMIHDVLSFQSELDFISHPYQLLAVSGIIAQETAAVMEKNKPSEVTTPSLSANH